MAITAAQVKELREKTGVGMMECKKALVENDGDLEKAVLWLRERGLSRAAKKADRVAAEGAVEVLINKEQNAGVLVEINCETDFVSRNEDFKSFASAVANLVLETGVEDVEKLSEAKLASGETVAQQLTNLISKIGENIKLRRVKALRTENGTVAGYSHMGGKIGSLVVIGGATGVEALELGKDVAMHVAAAAPKCLKPEEVDASLLEQEKELARKKLLAEGKPENMIEKILIGQMSKFYKEICLLEQPFVKEPKTSIKKHVTETIKGAELSGYVRFQLGEGIEKKKEDFAAEVAAAQNV